MAEKRDPSQLKAEAEARRAAAKEAAAQRAKDLEERRKAIAERSEAAKAARKEARAAALSLAEELKQARAEARSKAVEETKAAAAARKEAAQKEREAKASVRATIKVERKSGAAAPADKASAKDAPKGKDAAKKAAKPEPIHLALGLAIPPALERELGKALKSAAAKASEQAEATLKLPEGLDSRQKLRLEQARRKILAAFESAIVLVGSQLTETPIGSGNLHLETATGRASLDAQAIALSTGLRNRLGAIGRDLLAQATGDDAPWKQFPALNTAFMLQFFGDLETGQQLDGNLVMNPKADALDETEVAYQITLAPSGRKAKGPVLKLEFSHTLSLSNAQGSLKAAFPITIPTEPAKS